MGSTPVSAGARPSRRAAGGLAIVARVGSMLLLAGFVAPAVIFSSSAAGMAGILTVSESKPAAGKFLVASRRIKDPNFAKTVVLLLSYDEGGAAGLVVNRPTEVRPAEVLPDIKGLRRHKDPIHVGGPVARDHFLFLVQAEDPSEGVRRVLDGVWLGDSRELLERIAADRKRRQTIRIYAGFAGWAPGQLDAEIARGDWHIMTADRETVFTEDPSAVWGELVPPVRLPRSELVTQAFARTPAGRR